MRWMRPARKARTACGRNVFVPEADMTPGNVLAVRHQIHNHFVHASLFPVPKSGNGIAPKESRAFHFTSLLPRKLAGASASGMRLCWSPHWRMSFPVLAGRAGRKQWKIRRTNGGKKHKTEPKRLRFVRETTYGPEGRGFESLTAYQKSSKSSDFEDFYFS